MTDESFFARWSKRKAQTRAGKPVEEEPIVEPPPPEAPPPVPVVEPPPQPEIPAPTLEDVRSLTFDSDFKRFVEPDVPPEVKNAAVKKLFAHPRFNVRDMMDVYADDYSQPDPLPESMLRKLASARALKLFDTGAGTAENADDAGKESVAQSPPDADPDLQLQRHDAPAAGSAGQGIERGAAASPDAVPPGGRSIPEGDPR